MQLNLKLNGQHRTSTPVRNFDQALESFVAGCKAIHETDRRERMPHMPIAGFSIERGPRYIRIVKANHSRIAFCFVDSQTGAIYKAENWDRPGAFARGNIFDKSNGLANMRPYGPSTAGGRRARGR